MRWRRGATTSICLPSGRTASAVRRRSTTCSRAQPDRITFSYAPSRKDDFWQPLAVQVRLCLDYWRYLDSRYDDSPSLRARAARQAPGFASRLPRIPAIGSRAAMHGWNWLFRVIERAMPHGDTAARVLADHRPDLLLMTPLLYFGSQQVEYVRAATAEGIPCVLGVGSWDHLTTKGRIHERPDRLIVWNESQRAEAAELHGVAAETVTVTGAQAYDHWFEQRPSSTRARVRREGRRAPGSAAAAVSLLVAVHHAVRGADSSVAGSRACGTRRIPSCGARRS